MKNKVDLSIKIPEFYLKLRGIVFIVSISFLFISLVYYSQSVYKGSIDIETRENTVIRIDFGYTSENNPLYVLTMDNGDVVEKEQISTLCEGDLYEYDFEVRSDLSVFEKKELLNISGVFFKICIISLFLFVNNILWIGRIGGKWYRVKLRSVPVYNDVEYCTEIIQGKNVIWRSRNFYFKTDVVWSYVNELRHIKKMVNKK